MSIILEGYTESPVDLNGMTMLANDSNSDVRPNWRI